MSNQTKLIKAVAAILKNLFHEYKFKLIFQESHPEHFGNELIEYEFEDFLLFVTKDRNQLFIELAPKDSENKQIWLPKLFESIGVAKTLDFTDHNFQSLKSQLELLNRNKSEILRVLKQLT